MSILSELERLLREVAEQQAPEGRPRTPPPATGTPPARSQGQRVPTAQRASAAQRPRPSQARVVEAEVIDQPVRGARPRPPGRGIASRHLDTTDVSGHAEQLGHDLEQTDERLEARIHSKFDHDLTEIDDRLGPLADSAPSERVGGQAAAVKAMLIGPENLRRAILLREIIDRPTHRW